MPFAVITRYILNPLLTCLHSWRGSSLFGMIWLAGEGGEGWSKMNDLMTAAIYEKMNTVVVVGSLLKNFLKFIVVFSIRHKS